MNSLTPQQLLAEESINVWALNTSDTQRINGSKQRRALLMVIQLPDNNRASISVPDTWLPVNLSDSAPAKNILSAPNLLRAYSEGLIQFISDADATAINNRPGAEQERARLRQENDQVREATRRSWRDSASVVSGETVVSGDALDRVQVNHRTRSVSSTQQARLRAESFAEQPGVDMSALDPTEQTTDAVAAELEVSTSFKGFAQQLAQLAERDAIARLRARGTISKIEAAFLDALLSKEKYPSIKRFLAQSLQD